MGECGKGFSKKDGQLIKLVLMNTYDVFCSLFHTNWWPRKEDGKGYSFDIFYDLLIRDQQKLLDQWNLGVKQQALLLKGKGKYIYNDRGCVDVIVSR